jgi:hypothetical protein
MTNLWELQSLDPAAFYPPLKERSCTTARDKDRIRLLQSKILRICHKRFCGCSANIVYFCDPKIAVGGPSMAGSI